MNVCTTETRYRNNSSAAQGQYHQLFPYNLYHVTTSGLHIARNTLENISTSAFHNTAKLQQFYRKQLRGSFIIMYSHALTVGGG